jgi:hypothetical protein
MTRRSLLAAAIVAGVGLTVGQGLAHPGHGTMALVGTLATVGEDAVAIDVREVGSGVVTRVRVGIGIDTKLRLRKETLSSLLPWIGAAVVATVDYAEGPDGQTVYYATKIQVTPPKTKR